MRTERPEPILPAHDLERARAFYESLGFTAWYHDAHYEIVTRGELIVHLESRPDLAPETNRTSCYWRVVDADQLYREFAALRLPSDGIPRITPPEDEPWGMREFTLTDPSGNVVRVGHELSDA